MNLFHLFSFFFIICFVPVSRLWEMPRQWGMGWALLVQSPKVASHPPGTPTTALRPHSSKPQLKQGCDPLSIHLAPWALSDSGVCVFWKAPLPFGPVASRSLREERKAEVGLLVS